MRWVSAVSGGVVVALALLAWPEVSFFVTTYSGEEQSPSEFQMWWMESTRWLVVALGVLASASGATARRYALVPLAALLNAGLVCLALWRLTPPDGALVYYRSELLASGPWACLVALAVAVVVTAWRTASVEALSPK